MSLVSWPVSSCIMLSDTIVRVTVLGGPGAVGFSSPALSAAVLSIVTDLVAELAVLAASRAVALGSISTSREGLVKRSKSLSVGALHLFLGTRVEPDFSLGTISTGWTSLTVTDWGWEI